MNYIEITNTPTAKFIKITPSVAKNILEAKNKNNRRLRKWWSLSISEMIKRGEFKTTHQGIAFSKNGELLDGQHRLMAICLSDIPVKMLVVTGIDNDSFKVVDCGVKRSVSDLTGIDTRTAQVCRWLSDIIYNNTSTSERIIEIANCGIQEIHKELIKTCHSTSPYFSTTQMRLAACISIMDGQNKQYVLDTYTNMNLYEYSELDSLPLSLLKQFSKGNIQKSDRFDILARGIKVFNYKNRNDKKLLITDEFKKKNTRRVKMKIIDLISSD